MKTQKGAGYGPLLPMALVCSLILPLPGAHGAALRFNGELTGRDGKKKEDKALNQRYDLDFSHSLALTDLMRLQGAVRYSRTTDDGDTSQLITPSLRFDLANSLFSFGLYGTATRLIDSKQNDFDSKTWEANLASRWRPSPLPSIRLYFGQSISKDVGETPTSDSENTHAGASADWDTPAGAFLLTFSTDKTTDKISRRGNKSQTILGRFGTTRSFFSERLTLSFSQQISHASATDEAPVTTGGYALVPVTISAAMGGNDQTPTTGSLGQIGALLDNDLTTSAISILALPNQINIGIRNDFRQVDVIHLYTVDDISSIAGQFSFDVYTSDDGSSWTRKITAATFRYDSNKRLFEIETGLRTGGFVKLVAVATPTVAVEISEITAWRKVAASGDVVTVETDSEILLTDVGMNVNIHPDLSLRYNFAFQKNRFSDTADFQRKSYNGSLNWQITDNARFDFHSSAILQKRDNGVETLSRSHGSSVTYQPLPTLNLVAGLTLNETYSGSTKQNTSLNYLANVGAELYHDLDGRLDYSRTEAKNSLTGEKSTSDSVDLLLTARLFPSLHGDLRVGLQRTSSADEDKTTSNSSLLLNWRPSSYFGLRANLTRTWASTDATTIGLAADMAPTDKTQLSLSWNMARTTTTTQSYLFSWRWNIDEYLSFSTEGTYQVNEESSWQILARLRASYQVL